MDAPAKAPGLPLSITDLRRKRARSLVLRLTLAVVLPTAIAGVYYGAIASDQYESVSAITVESADSSATGGLESLMGIVPGASAGKDAMAVREYILSRDVLQRLDREHGYIAHFQSQDADALSRLAKDATFEEAYEYYLDMVSAEIDSLSGVLALKVRAFSANKSQEFSRAILTYSEEMVNDLAERARKDSVAFAEQQVQLAETRLSSARHTVLALQDEGADINPEQSAAAALSIRSQLQAELAQARAELSQARAFMRADAPKVVALAQRVQSLNQQVKQENRRMVEPRKGEGMHTTLAKFEAALMEKEFSEAAYAAALKTLEVAQAEASRKHRYLATIAQPSKPDEATHPRRIYGVFTVFAIALCLFAVGSLLIAAVREHARL